jgi:hypothetical protein
MKQASVSSAVQGGGKRGRPSAPIFLFKSAHRWRAGVLDLEPVRRSASDPKAREGGSRRPLFFVTVAMRVGSAGIAASADRHPNHCADRVRRRNHRRHDASSCPWRQRLSDPPIERADARRAWYRLRMGRVSRLILALVAAATVALLLGAVRARLCRHAGRRGARQRPRRGQPPHGVGRG